MEPGRPTLEELELIRQNLAEQIKEAEKKFSAERNGHELLTSKAALKHIEEAIRSAQEREVP